MRGGSSGPRPFASGEHSHIHANATLSTSAGDPLHDVPMPAAGLHWPSHLLVPKNSVSFGFQLCAVVAISILAVSVGSSGRVRRGASLPFALFALEIKMVKLLLAFVLVVAANLVAAAGVLRDPYCTKCCGLCLSVEVEHRGCTWLGSAGWCHVTECGETTGDNGTCCWSNNDYYVDVCTDIEAIDFGYHMCGECP